MNPAFRRFVCKAPGQAYISDLRNTPWRRVGQFSISGGTHADKTLPRKQANTNSANRSFPGWADVLALFPKLVEVVEDIGHERSDAT